MAQGAVSFGREGVPIILLTAQGFAMISGVSVTWNGEFAGQTTTFRWRWRLFLNPFPIVCLQSGNRQTVLQAGAYFDFSQAVSD